MSRPQRRTATLATANRRRNSRAATLATASRPKEQPSAKPSGWPEPIDILADPKLTGVATVDADCLPPSMLALAVAEGSRLQVDPSDIAALTIGVCSAIISDNWRVRLKVKDTEWTQHPRVVSRGWWEMAEAA